MDTFFESSTPSRVRAYIAFKKNCIREVIDLISPVTAELGRLLAEADALNGDGTSYLQRIAEALRIVIHQLPEEQPGNHNIWPNQVAIGRVREVLSHFALDHGLTFADARETSRYVNNEPAWGFSLTLYCPRWNKLFSDRASSRASLAIEVTVDNAGLNSTEIRNVEYLEIPDQLALRSSADTSWLCYPPLPTSDTLDSPSSSYHGKRRTSTYTDWKHTTKEHIEHSILPFAMHLCRKLLEAYTKVEEDDWDIDELYYALSKGVLTSTSFEHLVGEPHEAMVEECNAVLTDFRTNTGLELTSVDADFDSVQDWSCTMRFRCPQWQKQFETAIGCDVDLLIEVTLRDETCAVSAPTLGYFEVADLLTLLTVSDAYWKGPKVWLALQGS